MIVLPVLFLRHLQTCQHVQELDIRKEYEQQVSETLRRHQEKSKKPQKMTDVLIKGQELMP